MVYEIDWGTSMNAEVIPVNFTGKGVSVSWARHLTLEESVVSFCGLGSRFGVGSDVSVSALFSVVEVSELSGLDRDSFSRVSEISGIIGTVSEELSCQIQLLRSVAMFLNVVHM